MTSLIERALGGIHNGTEDYSEAAAILCNGFAATAMTTAAARLADDMAEAFGEGATSSDPAADIVTRGADYNGQAKRIRALASFGAMARELRRLQDIEAEQRKRLAELEAGLAGATERESAYREQRDSQAARAVKAEAILAELAYDIGELPARLALEVPAAASIIRQLPAVREYAG